MSFHSCSATKKWILISAQALKIVSALEKFSGKINILKEVGNLISSF